MAHCAYQTFPPSPLRSFNNNKASSFLFASSKRPNTVLLSAISHNNRDSYNTFVSEAVGLLGPAMFDASKLNVEFMGEDMNNYVRIIPRTYILSHCDFTANLTLTISNVINLEQLKGWYSKDDVVAEWKRVNGEMCLHIHCYVSGPNLLLDLAAEFRYHIFSKEMPLVLKAVLHGDSPLFRENPELLNALVRVYFHSSLKKYNRIECWGPLKDAVEVKQNMFMHKVAHVKELKFSLCNILLGDKCWEISTPVLHLIITKTIVQFIYFRCVNLQMTMSLTFLLFISSGQTKGSEPRSHCVYQSSPFTRQVGKAEILTSSSICIPSLKSTAYKP